MENVYSRANAHEGRSPPLQARPAACLHSPPRTPRDARMLALARPGARDDTLTPRALRAARRARLRELAPCDDPAPRLPTRGNNPRRCSLPRSARVCTPLPGAARLPHGAPPAGPPGSPAAPPVRCQRPAPCTPLMGGAGWADPLPAVLAALRACGLRLTHNRVFGDGNCFLHARACAAGTTARERAPGPGRRCSSLECPANGPPSDQSRSFSCIEDSFNEPVGSTKTRLATGAL